MTDLHAFTLPALGKGELRLADHAGKVLLLVNTASHCGFTPQYEGLEALHRRYAEKGLSVIGFPCNQFGRQEPGESGEIGAFCQKNYGVTFPLSDKIEVNGANTHPLWEYLKRAKRGIFGTRGIKWNFTKFLVDREGKVVRRFAPTTKPQDISRAIEALL
ncbi:MAG: glutathione peroxidase [Spirochaetes bacterium]|nr:glutathione peroxidase [Spirochaetota bacterium]